MSDISSIFTAEAAGILHAIYIENKHKSKTLIFSDSLSVIMTVHNPNNIKWSSVNKIRDLLIEYKSKIKLVWIPGYVNIYGNNYADTAAKHASTAPLHKDNICEKNDLRIAIHNTLRAIITTFQ